MLEKKVWAVIGASTDPKKYGNMIYKKLKQKGYEVYAVNPGNEMIDGDKCYKDLASLPVIPDVIDMVVAPKNGIGVIMQAAELGIKNIWLQPGTYNNRLLQLVEEKELTAVQACVLVALR